MARRLLVPAEHGTWGQILFPVITALSLTWPTPAAVLLAVAAFAAYLASEAVQTLAGWRGERARRERAPDARWSLVAFGGLAALAGGVGLAVAPPEARLAALVATCGAGAVWAVAAAGRLRTSAGEVLAGVALSAWAVPVALAAGIERQAAFAIWLVWAAAFSGATLAVRALIARSTRRPAAIDRAGALAIVAATTIVLVTFVRREAVASAVLVGFLPAAVITTMVACAPIHARRLRTVGWSVLAASLVLMLAIVVAGR